jgi:hypothetical protein
MDQPIEELYFNWLYNKIAPLRGPSTPSLTYYNLLRSLHNTEFVWTVPGDGNRAEDGRGLREHFLLEFGLGAPTPWLHIPCSVLEMLFAFAKIAAFETTISERDWFWRFLENLELAHLNDAQRRTAKIVEDRMDAFVWRTYLADGRGGLFPLRQTRNDQREVEIWYQFCEYVEEQDLV